METKDTQNIIEMRSITMRFPGVLANDRVDFSVRKGEIHALVGENGAGKTTLMNVLYGLYEPSGGQIFVKGEERRFSSPVQAIEAGLGMVHQHFMLIPSLTVAENVVLGVEPKKGIWFDWDTAAKSVQEICDRYGFSIRAGDKVASIGLGERQKIEIIKAIYRKADVLIMDEPTAVLTPQEIQELGHILQDLKADGKTIIIITHKLKEIMDFSDRVTVLRHGRKVGTIETKTHTPEDITYMMVGRHVDLAGKKEAVSFSGDSLRVEHLDYSIHGKKRLDDVSFSIRRGEIFGIAGVDGSGQNELTQVLAGFIKPDSGHIFFRGKDLTQCKARQIREMGVGIIPQSRQEHGLVLGMTLTENFLLGNHDRRRFLKRKLFLDQPKLEQFARERIEEYDIHCGGTAAAAETLSGGNQQKLICARECGPEIDLIIANQPSRGVDVGAIEHIHHVFTQARNAGKSVLLISMELDEVMMLSDRIMVMYDGKIMGILDGPTATREQIGLMMAGRPAGETEERR